MKRLKGYRCSIAALLLAAFAFWLQNAAAQEAGPIPNPSFEEHDGPRVSGWSVQTWSGEAKFDHVQEARDGQFGVVVRSESGGDAAWIAEFPVKPYSVYRFTGWVKTDAVQSDAGRGAFIRVFAQEGSLAPEPITGTQDWTRVEQTVDTGPEDTLKVQCALGGGGLATGTAHFDALTLEVLQTRKLDPHARLELDKTRPPMSKYIYGQFIEHLGHCIYGGIWAEMLDDRKFFHRVGSQESPWRVFLGAVDPTKPGVKLPGGVEMVTDTPFVGEHTPEVRLRGESPFGIMQGGLALRKGVRYNVRVVLAGEPEAGPLDVILVAGTKPDERQSVRIGDLVTAYTTLNFPLEAMGDTNDGALQIVGYGKGKFRVGSVSLMPADNTLGMRPDVLALLKELDSPVYRWPGGNFVSGYNWRDGIGDPDRRPPRKNPAWKGVEHNDFGIHEFMAFCRELGTEPYIVVNSGLGGAEEAVAQLEYVNGSADTPMGKLRTENGHPDPYRVKWWGVGNEMYGDWQLGHMPLEEYTAKHNAFAEAMRAKDSTIQIIAVGASGDWSQTMLADCGGHMDMLSEHFYCNERPGTLSHVRQMTASVRSRAEKHREYLARIPELAGRHIPVALDEWNYWYGKDVFGELGIRYHLKDALGVAAALNQFSRDTDVYAMANYAQTVNVLGAIKASKTAAALETTGLVLKLYRAHFGAIPVEVSGDTAPLDVAAAWREDRGAITVAIVNATDEPRSLPIETVGAQPSGKGKRWTITGDDPMAFNDPGAEPAVSIAESPYSADASPLEVPPLSVSLFELEVGRE